MSKTLQLDSFKNIYFEYNNGVILMNIVDNSGSRCILTIDHEQALDLCDILLELVKKGQND